MRGASNDSSEHLLIFRRFKQWVLGWSADHFVEGCAGGDHGVDAVFFFYLEVDEEGLAGGAGFCNCGSYIGTFADVGSGDAVGGGEGYEVGAEDGRGGVVLVVEGLLPLSDRAEEAVVDDGNVDGIG